MNENTEYEIFTKEIYQALLTAEGINNINVQHNIKLTGKSGQQHQIDVYWEYEIAGTKHKVAIECKNYNKQVSVGKIRDFCMVLTDLTNVNGIMVTKVGYQKGAKKLADYYGINLKELRLPNKEDWEGRIKTIVIEFNLVAPHIIHRIPLIDDDWVRANMSIQSNSTLTYKLEGQSDEINILDKEGKTLTSFFELDEKVPHDWCEATNLEHIYNFDDAYLEVAPLGKVKIKGVKYIYDVRVSSNKIQIDSLTITKAILKDAITGEIKFFHKDGDVKNYPPLN